MKIAEKDLWSVYLHQNQYYLGRAIIALKRHIEDPTDMAEHEIKNLFDIMRDYKTALKKVTSPDIINYSFLGNRIRHVHLHVVPRYSSPRIYENIKCEDASWGNPYNMYIKLNLPDNVMKTLIIDIRNNL